jgi:outer membrane protein OmpA-like peptidoglycan-associated protein
VDNFNRMANEDILEQREWSDATIEVLVDDIAVIPLKGGVCAGAQIVKDSLYAITWRHSEKWPPNDVVVETSGPPGKKDSPVLAPPALVVSPGAPAPGAPGSPVGSVPKTDTIVIPSIQFDFDKYMMQNPDTLQRYKSLLTRAGIKRIQVVGFTDDTGSEAYNLELSQKRAREIARLLAAKFGLQPAMISAEGRGISTVYPTKVENRRVEIYIFH